MPLTEAGVCLELFRDWLREARGQTIEVSQAKGSDESTLSALATAEGRSLAIEVRSLLPAPEADWAARRRELEERLAEQLEGRFALWLPPGADLPAAGDAPAFLAAATGAARTLRPDQRSTLDLPVTLYLRKLRDEGGVVSVIGSLDRYWTTISEGVSGSFDLDSTRLKRLPVGEDHRQLLFQRIRETANQVKAAGEWAEIETIDAWTLQRLADADANEFAVIGRPQSQLRDIGSALRRNFRRLLAEAAPALRSAQAERRALVVLGIFPYAEFETASLALRGYDPAVYAGIDFICLAVDGQIKPLVAAI
ncbi:MAG TPA: hypothetical protein VFB90_00955 [Dehalococcoidia bacterium]|nr:hypothetical protein [Dehalococcoidia bacterium]